MISWIHFEPRTLRTRRALDLDPKEYRERAKQELLDIAPIFFAPNKRELEKFCKKVEITDRGFTALILNAVALGFEHAIGTWEWVPPHLEWTPEVTRKIQQSSDAERLPIFRKLTNVFTERRLLTTHLFFRLETLEWHLFFLISEIALRQATNGNTELTGIL